MAILSVAQYQTLTAQALAGDALSAATAWCAAVSAALAKALLPYIAEPVTITDDIHDAPPSRDLLLHRRPVRSVTSVYWRPDANGLVSRFTSEYLLDNTDNAEYQLLIDDPVNGLAGGGILRRVGRVWGSSRVVYPDRLASTLVPERGSLKITYAAGPLTVPEDIQGAAVLAVSMLMRRKVDGMPLTSESWNGWSGSWAGPYTATAVIQSPDVQAMLSPYLPGLRIGG
jgi:hypothetical protein